MNVPFPRPFKFPTTFTRSRTGITTTTYTNTTINATTTNTTTSNDDDNHNHNNSKSSSSHSASSSSHSASSSSHSSSQSQSSSSSSSFINPLSFKLNQLSIQDRTDGLFDLHGVSEKPIIEEQHSEMIQIKLLEMTNALNDIVNNATMMMKKKSKTKTTRTISTNNVDNHNIDIDIDNNDVDDNNDDDDDDDETFAYRLAVQQSPQYVNNLKLRFLRSDLYHSHAAAKRMIQFFQQKYQYFGRTKLVKELTFDNDLGPDERDALQRGAIQLLPERDRAGRAILFGHGPLSSEYSTETVMKVMLYFYMTALKDEESQKNGTVVIYYGIGQTKTTPGRAAKSWKLWSSVPVRQAGFHICEDSSAFNATKIMISKYVESKRICRLRYHFGSHIECIYNLMTFGIPRNVIPIDDEGNMTLINHHRMLQSLKYWEEQVITDTETVTETQTDNELFVFHETSKQQRQQLSSSLASPPRRTTIDPILQQSTSTSTSATRNGITLWDEITSKIETTTTTNTATTTLPTLQNYHQNHHQNNVNNNKFFAHPQAIATTTATATTTTAKDNNNNNDNTTTTTATTVTNNNNNINTTTNTINSTTSINTNTTTANNNNIIFIPGPMDILLGKGRHQQKRPGMIRLNTILEDYYDTYEAASRFEKTIIAMQVLHLLKHANCRLLSPIKTTKNSKPITNTTTTTIQQEEEEDKSDTYTTTEEGGMLVLGYQECDEDTARAKIAHSFRSLRQKKRTTTTTTTSTKPTSTSSARMIFADHSFNFNGIHHNNNNNNGHCGGDVVVGNGTHTATSSSSFYNNNYNSTSTSTSNHNNFNTTGIMRPHVKRKIDR